MAKVRFLGCQYPIVKTPRGLMAQKSGVEQIKADLLQLLLTNPGERVMMPTYGVALRELFFEPNDQFLTERARLMIADAIRKWEPRIELEQVYVTADYDERDIANNRITENEGSILNIRILFYDPQSINEIQQLQLQVPLAGGS